MDTKYKHLVLLPEFWKWPDNLRAALQLTYAKPYEGTMVFHKLGFGRITPMLCKSLPQVEGVRIEPIADFSDHATMPAATGLGYFETVHIILPSDYEIDWDSYHAEA